MPTNDLSLQIVISRQPFLSVIMFMRVCINNPTGSVQIANPVHSGLLQLTCANELRQQVHCTMYLIE